MHVCVCVCGAIWSASVGNTARWPMFGSSICVFVCGAHTVNVFRITGSGLTAEIHNMNTTTVHFHHHYHQHQHHRHHQWLPPLLLNGPNVALLRNAPRTSSPPATTPLSPTTATLNDTKYTILYTSVWWCPEMRSWDTPRALYANPAYIKQRWPISQLAFFAFASSRPDY